MRRTGYGAGIIRVCVMVGILFWTPFLHAGQLQGDQFLGIWSSVDEGDGSLIQIVISPFQNKEYKLLWYESYWSVCDGGRGLLQGTGSLRGRALAFKTTIYCFNTETTVLEPTIIFTKVNNALLLAEGVDKEGQEDFADRPFYRLSDPVRKGFPYSFGQ